MPEANDGWFGKLGNPAHPGVSTFVGPTSLDSPVMLTNYNSGCTSTPVVDEKGTVLITEGLKPKPEIIYVVSLETMERGMFPMRTAVTPAVLEGSPILVTEQGLCHRGQPGPEWNAKFCAHTGNDSWAVAASKDAIVVQGGLTEPSDWTVLPPCDHVFALNPKNGETKWKFKTKNYLMNFCAAISGDCTIFTDMFGNLYCLKLADGSVLWQVAGEGSMICRNSGGASICGGVVYQATNLKAKKAPNMACGGKGAIRAYELKTGKLKWEKCYEAEKLEAHAIPVVAPKGPNGKPAVIVGVGNLAGSPPPSPPSGDEWRGKVVALDPADGKELWAFEPEPLKGVAVAGASSQAPWKASPWSSAACDAAGKIYITWHSGFVYMLDASTGAKMAEYEFGFACNGTPAIGKDGVLAVAGFHYTAIWHPKWPEGLPEISKELGFKLRGPPPRPFSESGVQHFSPCRVGTDAERPYCYGYEAPKDLSKPTWSSVYEARTNGEVLNGGVFIDSQRNIWAGWNGGHVRCIRPDGTIRAEANLPVMVSVCNMVLYEMQVLFLIQTGHVVSYNVETCEENWRKRVFSGIGASGLAPTLHEDMLLCAGRNRWSGEGEHAMACVSCKDGTVRWICDFSAEVPSYNTFPTVATLPDEGRKVACAGTLPGGIYSVYLDTGEMHYQELCGEQDPPANWRDGFTTASPTVGPGDGVLYQAYNHPDNVHGYMYAFDLRTKKRKWTYDCSRSWAGRQPVTQVPVIVPSDLTEDKKGHIVCIGLGSNVCGYEMDRGLIEAYQGVLKGAFVGVDSETGKERWTFEVPHPHRSAYPRGCCHVDTSPPDTWGGQVVDSRGVIYAYWMGGYLYAINGTTGELVSQHFVGSFANGAPAIAPGMLVVGAFDRVIVWRDEELEDKWVAENSSDPRAASFSKPLRDPEAREETGPLPPRGPLLLDLDLPFATIGQEIQAAEAAKAGAIAKPAAKKSAKAAKDGSGEGTVWVVVGGGSQGGIVARKGEGLKTAELGRVSTGSKIKELERQGDRLHFEKLSGDGPDFGWVSLTFKGSPLVKKDE